MSNYTVAIFVDTSSTRIAKILELNGFDILLPEINYNDVMDSLHSSDNASIILNHNDELRKLINFNLSNQQTINHNGQHEDSIVSESKAESQVEFLKQNLSNALESINSFQSQQNELFEEFVKLRDKYDDLKTNLTSILWNYLPKHHPTNFKQIPLADENICEYSNRVGNYELHELLGEGQFASVLSCSLVNNILAPNLVDNKLAIKVIKKEKVISIASLQRIDHEILALRTLKHEGILKIYDVFQSKLHLCLILEQGGKDLFEYFDSHPRGVNENDSKLILKLIITPIYYSHKLNIYHRDLKPENILLEVDACTQLPTRIKICDFGLCAITKDSLQLLSDFCGSPGFFAPEMLTHNKYFGDKVDIWSIGCILLELILGHEKFYSLWMECYDYQILQNPVNFELALQQAIDKFPTYSHISNSLLDLLTKLLCVNPKARTTLDDVLHHPWLDIEEAELNYITRYHNLVCGAQLAENKSDANTEFSYMQRRRRSVTPTPTTILSTINNDTSYMNYKQILLTKNLSKTAYSVLPVNSETNQDSPSKSINIPPIKPHVVDQNVYKNSLSSKARNYIMSRIMKQNSRINLPPIEPPTPSVDVVRKMVSKKFTDEDVNGGKDTGEKKEIDTLLTSPPPRKQSIGSPLDLLSKLTPKMKMMKFN